MSSVYTILTFHDPGIQYEPPAIVTLGSRVVQGKYAWDALCEARVPTRGVCNRAASGFLRMPMACWPASVRTQRSPARRRPWGQARASLELTATASVRPCLLTTFLLWYIEQREGAYGSRNPCAR